MFEDEVNKESNVEPLVVGRDYYTVLILVLHLLISHVQSATTRTFQLLQSIIE